MRSVFLSYDIPQRIKIANPTAKLRSLGVRVNLSVWIIPEHAVPHGYLDELREAGAVVYLVRFDESEQVKLLEMARKALENEASRIVKGMEASIERAAKIMEPEGFLSVSEEQTERYEKYMRVVLRRAGKELIAAKCASSSFDLFQQLEYAFAATEQAIKAAQDAFLASPMTTTASEVCCA